MKAVRNLGQPPFVYPCLDGTRKVRSVIFASVACHVERALLLEKKNAGHELTLAMRIVAFKKSAVQRLT